MAVSHGTNVASLRHHLDMIASLEAADMNTVLDSGYAMAPIGAGVQAPAIAAAPRKNLYYYVALIDVR